MKRFRYATVKTVIIPRAMPEDGLREILRADSQTVFTLGRPVSHILVYDRPLSLAEVQKYKLIPITERMAERQVTG